MNPQIDNPTGLELSPDAICVLQQIFARYKRVIVLKEFGVGLSGGRVLEVRPIKADGTPELPTVVKLATVSMIQQEWRAYQKHIHNRLPHIAAVSARPKLVAATGWGGLRYPLIGVGGHDILSLRDFCDQPDVDADRVVAVLERLLRIMDNVWGFSQAAPNFALQPSYSLVLPPDLVLRPLAAPGSPPAAQIAARSLPRVLPQLGDTVALSGFVAHKVDPARRTVTLRSPARPDAPVWSVRLRLPTDQPMPEYRALQIVDVPAGEVLETRASRLRAEAAGLGAGIDPDAARVPLGEGVWLANPLDVLPRLLAETRSVNVASIHGDFNLENVLVEPQLGDVSLIDFAEARQDHVLHDLLHLETEIVTHILPGVLRRHQIDAAPALAEFGWRLHRAMVEPADDGSLPEHPALRKPWVMLRAIRRAARRYLFDAGDPGEYYHGLVLHLLGALRYKSLSQRPEHPLPKRLAFWAAALAYQWLRHPAARTPPPALAPLLARSLWAARPQDQAAASAAPRRQDPAELLAALPIERLPPGGDLPLGSRMPLERNPRFVGRQAELQELAAGVKRASSGSERPSMALAIVGLGGVGKTQLACEFAQRFGRFFAGGVFWLACADPEAVAPQIAACGERAAMNLRPTFHELPLEEQVQLVLEEWRKPLPRLLIFDNCETPELLARWFPAEGGCRALITSRRSDWDTAGIPALALDVLRRRESLELLRAHQPDAENTQLDQIADELGDLPLALHLAGSYLARYRHTTDAAGYLAGLRQASPLRHQSLQGRGLLPTEHDPHVARTFAISYDQLDREGPAVGLARALIHGAACLAPGVPIPESLARVVLLAHQGAPTAATARVGFELGSAVDQLIELGLVRAEADRAMWVHRLVAAFTGERLGADLERVRGMVERALCAVAESLNEGRDPARLRAWQVHLRYVADAARPRGDIGGADLCHALAEHLYQIGDFPGARVYHEHALTIRQAAQGADHPATARALTQVGKALFFYGDAGRARPYFEQALAIQQARLGDHSDTATTLNHLGFLLQRQGEIAAARGYHEQALRIWRSILGTEHPAIVDSLCNLAYVEYVEGNLGAAEALLYQALAVQRQASGDDHVETARVRTNLGELLLAQGKLEEAERVLHQVLAFQERELGVEHPETARTFGQLGEVRRQAGDIARAREYYERALSVFQICHGADHFRTRRVREQLAALSPSSG